MLLVLLPTGVGTFDGVLAIDVFGDLGVSFVRFAMGLPVVGDSGDDAASCESIVAEVSGLGGPSRRTRRPRGTALGDAVVAAVASFSPPVLSDDCD